MADANLRHPFTLPHRLARLDIDPGALTRNWQRFAGHVAPATCAAVVKADAYGLGMEAVSRALHRAGCEVFVTALPGEALALRSVLSGPRTTIWTLSAPTAAHLRAAADARVSVVLNTVEEVARWAAMPGRPEAGLHIDTGMNRLGIGPAQAPEVAATIGDLPIRYLFTHLVSGAEPETGWNDRQSARLDACRAAFAGVPLSLANSGGALTLAHRPGDKARIGIALYGAHPRAGHAPAIEPVAALHAPVLQVRDIGPGDSVGYDATWTAGRASRLATVSAGYADGLPRTLSNRGSVLLHGARCPIVGRVSMDSIVVDVTDAPPVAPGDQATIFGPGLPIESCAHDAGTIPYELLCAAGRACTRVWLGG